ncbi:MAG: cyclic nucleotide-binding domain-containing protein [Desulfobacterales bacterium]|jgi:CRP-like cAMP-binding protein
MVSLDFLESVEVFKDLDDNQLRTIQNYCQITEFKRGEKIFSAGEDPLFLWVVMQGQVDLHWEMPGRSAFAEKAVSTLSKASTFGWSSLVPPYKYRLSAYCASRTSELVKIARDDLINLFEEDAEIGYKVMSQLISVVGSRFLNLQEEVAKLRGRDIINRW